MQSRHLDTLTNLITIAAAGSILITVWQLQRNIHSRNETHAPASYQIGEQINPIEGVSFSNSPINVLLFVRSTCHFCSDSMPFYRRLSAELHAQERRRLYVLSDESIEQTERYLAGFLVKPTAVARSSPEVARRVVATPTIFVVDSTGRVIHVAIGQLTAMQEAALRSVIF